MDKIISMKDIRLSLSAIAKRAEAGERFIVVRDSKPVFRIEPCATETSGFERKITFSEFTAKVDRVRESDGTEWTPDAVEKVIQEMYHERKKGLEGKGQVRGGERQRGLQA